MRSAASALPDIERRVKRGEHLVLFLDFDGTLAPIVQNPSDARMSAETKGLVSMCARRFATYIVSGRALSDIRHRAPVQGVGYAGNHGREWTGRSGQTGKAVSRAAYDDVREALAALKDIRAAHGSMIEDKKISFAFHYRKVAASERAPLLRRARHAFAPILARGRIEILHQKKLLDIRPKGWHKGDFVRLVLDRAKKPNFAIFIGDDMTDEDAFRAVGHGYAIRVGKSSASHARYYVDSVDSVAVFLKKLAAL